MINKNNFFLSLNNKSKVIINAIVDAIMIFLGLFISSYVLGDINPNYNSIITIFDIGIIISINLILSLIFKIYLSIKRHLSFYDFKNFFLKNIILVTILIILFEENNFFYFLFFFNYIAIALLVFSLGSILILNNFKNFKKRKILIYGAGETGQLIFSKIKKKFHIIAYIDDDHNKINRYVNGVRIYSSDKINKLIQKFKITAIYIAIPSLSTKDEKLIFEKLSQLNIDIFSNNKTNNFDNLVFEKIKKSFKSDTLTKNLPIYLKNNTVLISGAAGSIGEEISFQILNSDVKKIILIDSNESQLSWLKKSLNNNNIKKINLYFYLCSLTDKKSLDKIFEKHKPQIIFHAAAYKHVDIVEENYIFSLKNNLISLHNILECSSNKYLNKFVFISSDKAVKPLNIMGMSKRVGEIMVNSMNKINKNNSFISVRFGNVIGSSGSLFQIFKRQVDQNLPLTITHKDTTRYFMTIYDAINLVINAPDVKSKAGILILDMGKPIKIIDIANKFISFKSDYNQKLNFIGLRRGEKLHEELFNHKYLIETDNQLIKGENVNFSYSKKEISKFIFKVRNLENEPKMYVKKLLKTFYKF